MAIIGKLTLIIAVTAATITLFSWGIWNWVQENRVQITVNTGNLPAREFLGVVSPTFQTEERANQIFRYRLSTGNTSFPMKRYQKAHPEDPTWSQGNDPDSTWFTILSNQVDPDFFEVMPGKMIAKVK
jgi:hypothetical protein